MTELESRYDASELGWVADTVELSSNIYLMVDMEKAGYVVIKQYDDVTGDWPKVLVSGICLSLKSRIRIDEGVRKIRILTSEEPKSIKYVNI